MKKTRRFIMTIAAIASFAVSAPAVAQAAAAHSPATYNLIVQDPQPAS